MSIKPQDIVVLVKLLARQGDKSWFQNSIAFELCLSPSQINSAFKRLIAASLITSYHPPSINHNQSFKPARNFLLMDLKYIFPAKLGRNSSRSSHELFWPEFKKSNCHG